MEKDKSSLLEDKQIAEIWGRHQKEEGETFWKMVEQSEITIGDKTLRFKYFKRGSRPVKGYSLVFGFHGGGGCPSEVNERQYVRHMELYNDYLPEGIIWIALRSCEEAPDMWWKGYLPNFLSIIIKGFTLTNLVNPNKVFITGYSAGGDGVYHLGPMIADWLAGAAMMAGHPNGVELYNVRSTVFSIQVGGKDEAYDRNYMGGKYIRKMIELGGRYGGFSTRYCNIFGDCEHWMCFKDAGIFNDFLKEERNPYPELILFKQHPRLRKPYFYYVQVDPDSHKELLVVHKRENDFFIESQKMAVSIYVNRRTVNYAKEVRVFHNSSLTVVRKPERDLSTVKKSIEQRGDVEYIFEDFLVSIPNNGRFPLETTIEASLAV